MTALTTQPTNRNFLAPDSYMFQIKRAPHVNFFLQQISIPSITLQEVNVPTPMVRFPVHGEHLLFGDLDIVFKVDEDLKNYLELYNWIVALGTPENLEQYAEIASKPVFSGEGIYADVCILPLTNTKMPNYEIVFVDAHPTGIGAIRLYTTDKDINYLVCSAKFKYTHFTIKQI